MIWKPLQSGYYTNNGSGVRRILQYGDRYSKIDILVREAVQNSYDALRDSSDMLEMSFVSGSFDTVSLASELKELEDILPDRFGHCCDFLELRDIGTCGLDGPVEALSREYYGNFMKMVFASQEKQTGVGKGGSWGYGKSNYFNFGAGIVIFYTRIRSGDAFESRLIAVLIDDVDQPRHMLLKKSEMGISFWGEQSPNADYHVLPVTDESYIERFLGIFGLKPFGSDETGTSIVIPFINRSELVKESMTCMGAGETVVADPDDFQHYVELAVQRWYFPRLMNFGSSAAKPAWKPLYFSFNGAVLTDERMIQIFLVMREIYNETFSDGCKKIPVKSQSLKGGSAEVAYYSSRVVRVSDLGSDRGVNPYGILETGKKFDGLYYPIGFRCRSLGMVNSYDVCEGIVSQCTPCDFGDIMFVCLRPIPDVCIYQPDNFSNPATTFEQYLRLSEDSTHSEWNDINLNTIDKEFEDSRPRINNNMYKAVSLIFGSKPDLGILVQKPNLGLSRKVGEKFLPRLGYGKGSSPAGGRSGSDSGGGGGSGGSSGTLQSRIVSGCKTSADGNIVLDTILEFGSRSSEHSLILSPDMGDSGSMSVDEWEKECGVSFPVSVSYFEIGEVDGKEVSSERIVADDRVYDIDSLRISPRIYGDKMYGIDISCPSGCETAKVRIAFTNNSCVFKMDISFFDGRQK